MSRETVIRIAILCWLAAVWVALWGLPAWPMCWPGWWSAR